MDVRTRRQALENSLTGGLLVATAYEAVQLSGDMAVPFLQEANFLWLTNLPFAGWKVIIDSARQHVVLVRPARSHTQELFDGKVDEASLVARAAGNEVIDEREFEGYLRRLARQHPLVYTPFLKETHEFVANPAPAELHALLTRVFTTVSDCTKQLAELRAIKSPEEIAAIRRAVALTVQAFTSVRTQLGEYRHEYEIEADMTRDFRRLDARHAYEPIIASGDHAVTLHYIQNSGKLAKTQPVLIDVGARIDGYAADITRTYCLKPTKRQQAVHRAVEIAHQRIIALLGPDKLVTEYLAEVDDAMKDALSELGLLEDRSDNETYRRYFPHAISHGLGIDVHDSLGAPRYFRPGMVLTVEPGIYIPEEGIGVRIEDDILITEMGHENLSRKLPTGL